MKQIVITFSIIFCGLFLLFSSCKEKIITSATVPMILDHNRMMVTAEIKGKDGSWHEAKLWVDTGNPNFMLNPAFARKLGYEWTDSTKTAEFPPLNGVRIGGMTVNFDSVKTNVVFGYYWMFNALHNDGNLPSSVLQRYDIVFDYPAGQFTIAEPGIMKHKGVKTTASINPQTGVPQIDAVVDGDSMSFALDMGASWSFVPAGLVDSLSRKHPDWPVMTGTASCANMWGWWPPGEENMTVLRIPEINWGGISLDNVAVVGVSNEATGGYTIGQWYSQKTTRPVVGFLGPNAFKAFRVEIDFASGLAYFEKSDNYNYNDLDCVGISLSPQPEGSWIIRGIVKKNGKPVVEGIEPGDKLLQVDSLITSGITMGAVSDALRGNPGEVRILEINHAGKTIKVEAKVMRLP